MELTISINKDGLKDSEVCELKEFLGLIEPNEIINVLEGGECSFSNHSNLEIKIKRRYKS